MLLFLMIAATSSAARAAAGEREVTAAATPVAATVRRTMRRENALFGSEVMGGSFEVCDQLTGRGALVRAASPGRRRIKCDRDGAMARRQTRGRKDESP